MQDYEIPRILDLSYRRGLVQAVTDKGLCAVTMPDVMMEDFDLDMKAGRIEHAAELVRVVWGTSRFLGTVSKKIGFYLGSSPVDVSQTLEALCQQSGVSRYKLDSLKQLTTQLSEVIFAKFSRSSEQRRLAGGRIWLSDPVLVEAEMMGWEGFLSNSEVAIMDHRRNIAEASVEVLCNFRNRKFLLATCGTGQIVMLPVGKDVTSCDKAQEWLAGDSVNMFPLPKFFSVGRT